MDQGKNVIIMGAAGRDFHNFNVCFRDNPQYRVIAFTATQIPDIDGRFIIELVGSLYRRSAVRRADPLIKNIMSAKFFLLM